MLTFNGINRLFIIILFLSALTVLLVGSPVSAAQTTSNICTPEGGLTNQPSNTGDLIGGDFTKTSFGAITSGTPSVTLEAPAMIMPDSGFYVTINITGAADLNGYLVHLGFDPNVIQMAGVDGLGSGSGITDGVINGTDIPFVGWTYQPTPGTPSGEIAIMGKLSGIKSVNGSGSLAKVHLVTLPGTSGNLTSLSLSTIELVDSVATVTYLDNPLPVTVTISNNETQVTAVTTSIAGSISDTTATLNGILNSLGTATTVNLFLGYSSVQGGPYTLVAGPTVTSVSNLSLPLSYSGTVTGLTPDIQYFCVAQAQYGSYTITGTELSFYSSEEIQPVLTSISPSKSLTGATLESVVITGTKLTGATAVNFSGSGVTASNIMVISDTQITAAVTIASDAVAGSRDMTVTTAAGISSPLTGAFTVLALPVLNSISPSSGLQGNTISVTITGTNLSGASAVSFIGTGLTVSNITVISDTQITAAVTIASNAATGSRDLTVSTTVGTSSPLTGAFTVLALPVLSSISPSSGLQGNTISVTITGTNLSGASAVSFNGTGLTVSNITVISDTQITAAVTIASDAATGSRDLTVTTAAGISSPLAGSFTVNASVSTSSGGGGYGGGYSPTLPVVKSVTASSGATGVPANSTVKAVFSMAMDSTTITASTFILSKDGEAVAGTVYYDSATYTAIFTPSSTLDYSTVYTATMTTGVKNLSGYGLSSNYVWTFTTAAAPEITTTSQIISKTPVTTTAPASGTPTTTFASPTISNPAITSLVPTTTKHAIDINTVPAAITAGAKNTTTVPSETRKGFLVSVIVIAVFIIGIASAILIIRYKNKR
jgi:hypothetical protein